MTALELVNTVYELMDCGDTERAVELVEQFARDLQAAEPELSPGEQA